MADSEKYKGRFWIYLVGALLTGGLGLLLTLPLGDGLARLSYDLPFAVQNGNPADVVMVYLNPQVKKNLGEQKGELDRSYHTRLVERLHADGAKLILFDFLNFDTSHADPAVDQRFVEAARAHGRVGLVIQMTVTYQMNVKAVTPIPLAPQVAQAAAAWGVAEVDKDTADDSVRHMLMATNGVPSVGWVAAKLLDAPVTRSESNWLHDRWLNYYGPPGCFRAVNYDHALRSDGLPAGFFRDKIVIVCFGDTVGVAGTTQDQFANPYCRFGARRSFGGEVHAQTLLNLLYGDWLERLSSRWELALIVAWSFLLAFGLSGRRPWTAALLVIAAVLLLFAGAILIQLRHHVWWNWMIPAVQAPVALVWSVGYQYAVESRRRKKLRRAFSVYLSPYMADRIANSEFDLSLGGKEVEASVMFTDLEGFTKMSETLPPAEVSKILTAYFNHTTRAILEQEGTIIKYIGDAVLAVWGAPLSDARHAERAVLAAWGMSQAGKEEIAGRRLRTRIGINTGMLLAGNLGSDFRFDYTLIGDTVNFASRLEGLNKYLGTDILISETTRVGLGGEVQLRNLGRFLAAGKTRPVGIFEVLGPASRFQPPPDWLSLFDEALDQFGKRRLDEAVRTFREVITQREGKDGPSEFYLGQIENARRPGASDSSWDGVVRLTEK